MDGRLKKDLIYEIYDYIRNILGGGKPLIHNGWTRTHTLMQAIQGALFYYIIG